MQKKSAEETLKMLIEYLLICLDELKEYSDEEKMQFEYGERVAYTECLEVLQVWRKAKKNGLSFDIEKQYPL